MLPILSFYVGRHFLAAMGVAFGFTASVILLFETIEMLRRTGSHPDVDFWTAFTMAALKSPQTVHMTMPFVVMVAAMLTFWRLTRSSELVVVRSIGVSAWQIISPVVLLSLSLGALEVAALNPLSAAMFSSYERMEDEIMHDQRVPLSLSQGGLWLREARDGEQVLVHAEGVRQDAQHRLRLEWVSILVFGEADEYRYRIDAKSSSLAGGYFDLYDAWLFRPGEPAQRHEEYRLPTGLTVSKIQDKFASPQNLSFWELPAFINFYESAGFSATRQRMYWQSLLAKPAVLCAMALLAAAFMLHHNLRRSGLALRVGGAVAAGFLFYATSKVIHAFGASAALPLVLAAWSPPIVAASVGLTVLLFVEDG